MFQKHMGTFYKLSRPGKDKKPRNILAKKYFKVQLDWYKVEKFWSLYSRGRIKYFQLKLLCIMYFLQRLFLPLSYISMYYTSTSNCQIRLFDLHHVISELIHK